MSPAVRGLTVLLLASALPLLLYSQVPPAEQTFHYPVEAVNQALDRLGAAEGRLPMLDGFVSADPAQLSRFTLPYYQLSSEVKADTDGATLVRVSAHISALYTDPETHRSEYRTLPSKGRVEADLLERLAHELAEQSNRPKLDREAVEATLNALRGQHSAAEERKTALSKQIHDLESVTESGSLPQLVTVERAGAAVLASPEPGAAVLFQAQLHDEFEVAKEGRDWTQIQLGHGNTGWIRRSQLRQTDATPGFSMANPGFRVVRENVVPFSGSWAVLKGKPALFLWARPEPESRQQDLWAYAQQMFEERADTAGPAEGIVVVFLGEPGVAAATVRDIQRWTRGSLSDAVFRAHCSLDPPRAFGSPKTTQLTRNNRDSSLRRSSP